MARSPSPGLSEATAKFIHDVGKESASGDTILLQPVDWTPHRPARPAKTEAGRRFKLVSPFEPAGDQPNAIKELVAGINAQETDQVLLGVTGSGKTFTMAKIIEATQRPALILAPKVNKEGADSAGRVAGAAVARRRVTEALLLLESLSMKKSGMAQVKVNASGALALSGRVRWQVRALPGWSAAAVTTIQS